MKKTLISIIIILLILPSIFAINVNIEKQSSNEVLIKGINMPAVFDIKITNLGEPDKFKFYNLVGFMISPETISLNHGETKEIMLRIFPIGDLKINGPYTFAYTIKGQDNSEIDQQLTVKIMDLKDSFEIGADEFDSSTSSLNIYINNKVNFDFDQINAEFTSPFFNFEKTFSLAPNEKKSFEVQLNKEDFKKLMAGFYTLNAKITAGEEKADVEGTIKFVEKNLVTTTEDDLGFIITTKTIEKINEGNVLEKSQTVIKKNILSRLFTSFNLQPDIVERKGFIIYYTWNKEIKPGENLKIIIKTNWLFPLLVILFIVTIVALAKQYSKKNLVLKKKVSFVKAKGGEFALKISIIINARKYIEKVNIIDRLPPLVKIHERFGGEHPKRINEKSKRIEWGFEKLEAGENRILSYIIYSKIGVLGKFALPTATAIYEKEGKIHETQSNRAFFMAEQGRKEIDD